MYILLHLEKKTHMLLSFVSASGYVLPPMMVSEEGVTSGECAVANTLFVSSENG